MIAAILPPIAVLWMLGTAIQFLSVGQPALLASRVLPSPYGFLVDLLMAIAVVPLGLLDICRARPGNVEDHLRRSLACGLGVASYLSFMFIAVPYLGGYLNFHVIVWVRLFGAQELGVNRSRDLILVGVTNVVFCGLLAILWGWIQSKLQHSTEPIQCPHCDYDLRGSTLSEVCPECGNPFNRAVVEDAIDSSDSD